MEYIHLLSAFAGSATGEGFESQLVDQLALDDLSGNSFNASNTCASWQTSVKKFYDGALPYSGQYFSVYRLISFESVLETSLLKFGCTDFIRISIVSVCRKWYDDSDLSWILTSTVLVNLFGTTVLTLELIAHHIVACHC